MAAVDSNQPSSMEKVQTTSSFSGKVVRATPVAAASARNNGQRSVAPADVRAGGSDGGSVVGAESADPADRSAPAKLVEYLVVAPDVEGLSGAELCVGAGWVGLRSHPAPTGTVNYGGPELPDWFDDAVRALVGPASPRA